MEYTKTCNSCRVEKPVESFSFADKNTGRRSNKCKECKKIYYKKYKSENSESIRNKWRKASKTYSLSGEKRRNKTLAKYGLKNEDYNKMFLAQNGKCKICSSELTLVVDHCHITGKIRGLLCNKCNVGLGCFKDNIEQLKLAIDYLKGDEDDSRYGS